MGTEDNSPYMLLVAPVNRSRRPPHKVGVEDVQGIQRLEVIQSEVPAITHVDYSARVQTVDVARNPRYHKLIQTFDHMTECPVIINTSFNVRGEPIVCTPEDAYRCFMGTDMDALVIKDFLLLKEDQAKSPRVEQEQYLARFELD